MDLPIDSTNALEQRRLEAKIKEANRIEKVQLNRIWYVILLILIMTGQALICLHYIFPENYQVTDFIYHEKIIGKEIISPGLEVIGTCVTSVIITFLVSFVGTWFFIVESWIADMISTIFVSGLSLFNFLFLLQVTTYELDDDWNLSTSWTKLCPPEKQSFWTTRGYLADEKTRKIVVVGTGASRRYHYYDCADKIVSTDNNERMSNLIIYSVCVLWFFLFLLNLLVLACIMRGENSLIQRCYRKKMRKSCCRRLIVCCR